LNDRYDPDWTVTVDGKPAELLRCNYLMRGVRLEPGEHLIKFALRPSQTGLYLSLTALAAAVVLLGVLMFIRRHPTKPTDPSPGGPQSAVKAPSGDRGTSRKA
jgi:hypothetical protein